MRIVSKSEFIYEFKHSFILLPLFVSPPFFIALCLVIFEEIGFINVAFLVISALVLLLAIFFTTEFSKCRIDFANGIIRIKHWTFFRRENIELPIKTNMFFHVKLTDHNAKLADHHAQIFLSVGDDEASQYPLHHVRYGDKASITKMNKVTDRLNVILKTGNDGERYPRT